MLLPPIQNNTSNFVPISEGQEIENSDREEAEELVHQMHQIKPKAKGKRGRRSRRKKKVNDDESETPLKLMKIDSLLLRPGPGDQQGHAEQDNGYSADSYLEDMEMQMPEPTAVEKLKYHLTEARLPPSRRKTYNYSHI